MVKETSLQLNENPPIKHKNLKMYKKPRLLIESEG